MQSQLKIAFLNLIDIFASNQTKADRTGGKIYREAISVPKKTYKRNRSQ